MQLHSHSVMQSLNQPLSESVIPVIRSDCQYISELVSQSVSQLSQYLTLLAHSKPVTKISSY